MRWVAKTARVAEAEQPRHEGGRRVMTAAGWVIGLQRPIVWERSTQQLASVRTIEILSTDKRPQDKGLARPGADTAGCGCVLDAPGGGGQRRSWPNVNKMCAVALSPFPLCQHRPICQAVSPSEARMGRGDRRGLEGNPSIHRHATPVLRGALRLLRLVPRRAGCWAGKRPMPRTACLLRMGRRSSTICCVVPCFASLLLACLWLRPPC